MAAVNSSSVRRPCCFNSASLERCSTGSEGADDPVDREAAQGDPDNRPKLVADWADEKLERTKAARQFEVVLQSLVEHYDEYRDYNTTTTQSDYGENIHILLDFLRLKVRYDRVRN